MNLPTESPILVRVFQPENPPKSSVVFFWGPGKEVGKQLAAKEAEESHTFELVLDTGFMRPLLCFLDFGREFLCSSLASPQKIVEHHALSAWQTQRGVEKEGFPAILSSKEERFLRVIEDKERYHAMIAALKKATSDEAKRFIQSRI